MKRSQPLNDRRRTMIAAVLIVAAGLAAYANSFSGVFVFDDVKAVAQNPAMYRLWPPYDWMAYCPPRLLVYFTFAANYSLHGTDVLGYHAVNLAIHLAAALALWGLVRRTLSLPRTAERYRRSKGGIALAIALVWVVHPLGTQGVTYIYQRLESLAALGTLLTLYAFARAYADPGERRRRWAAISLISAAGAMLSKESALILPLITLTYDYLFFGGSWREVLRHRRYHVASFCLLGIALGLVAAAGDDYEKAGIGTVEGLTPLSYALSQSGVIIRYLQLSVLPVGLCLDYGRPLVRQWHEFVPQTVFLLALVGISGWGLFRGRLWSFPLCVFFLLLAPTSSVIPIADLIFEHRMYLPLAAVVALLTCGVVELLERLHRRAAGPVVRRRTDRATKLLFVAVVAVLAFLTHRRNDDYRSYEGMWRDVIAKAPLNTRGYTNVADALIKQNRNREARTYLQRALEINPDQPYALWTLGWMDIVDKNFDGAERCVARLERNGAARSGYWSLKGMLYAARRQYAEAIDCFQASLHSDFDDAQVVYNLGLALEGANRHGDAAAAYANAVELQPNFAAAHNKLGLMFFRQGLDSRAVPQFRDALRVEPENVDIRANLGAALLRAGLLSESVAEFRRCVAIDERFLRGRINLGIALARLGRFDEAAAQIEVALTIDPSNKAAQENLLWVRQLQSQAVTQANRI